jgi:dihydroxy-acid dehydratase
MGAASCGLPAIVVSGGPMLNGRYGGKAVGSGTDIWRFGEAVKAGTMALSEFLDAEAGMARSAGSCMTMGTASTMASMAEALGIALPSNAAIPAVDARRNVLAQMAGRRIVDMVLADTTIGSILTREAFENAVRVNAAIGGSTNAVLHLIAIAGRLGVPFGLDDWDRLGRGVPTIVDLMPSGRFLMEEFYYAGGLPVVIKALLDAGLLHGHVPTVSGRTLAEDVADATNFDEAVIRPLSAPLTPEGGVMVLRGNLVPGGAVIKPSASTPALMQHTGRAVVFETIEHYHERIGDPDLPVDETSVMVLKNCGPRGYPGMAEVGNMGLPPKILKKGVTDMVRISDARMSGTAYGTVCLHAAPEAALGGPLAVVQDGDMISLDCAGRSLSIHLTDADLAARLASWTPPEPAMLSGYQKLYVDHVLQADRGCDLDFLVGSRGAAVPRHSH